MTSDTFGADLQTLLAEYGITEAVTGLSLDCKHRIVYVELWDGGSGRELSMSLGEPRDGPHEWKDEDPVPAIVSREWRMASTLGTGKEFYSDPSSDPEQAERWQGIAADTDHLHVEWRFFMPWQRES